MEAHELRLQEFQNAILGSIQRTSKDITDRLVHIHSSGFCMKKTFYTVESFLKSPPENIVKYPDETLRTSGGAISDISDNIRQVCRIMFDLMYKFNGCGLAAPQVGLGIRLFVVNHIGLHDKSKERVFINPEIFHYGTRATTSWEGCLSLPQCGAMIDRPHKIMIKYWDENGQEHKSAFEGLMSRIVQHEFDHVEGKLITDRMSSLDFKRVTPTLQQLESDARQTKESA